MIGHYTIDAYLLFYVPVFIGIGISIVILLAISGEE